MLYLFQCELLVLPYCICVAILYYFGTIWYFSRSFSEKNISKTKNKSFDKNSKYKTNKMFHYFWLGRRTSTLQPKAVALHRSRSTFSNIVKSFKSFKTEHFTFKREQFNLRVLYQVNCTKLINSHPKMFSVHPLFVGYLDISPKNI